MDTKPTLLVNSMIKFESQDLYYQESEERSTHIHDKPPITYEVLHFRDMQTKRAVFTYNWSGVFLSGELIENQRYYVRGLVNTQGKQCWLVMTGIGLVRDGKIYDVYKDKEGVTKIETTIY